MKKPKVTDDYTSSGFLIEFIIESVLIILMGITIRVLFVMHKITTGHSRRAYEKRTTPCKTVICIGSGGHTTEMLKLLRDVDFRKYKPRYYVMASSDKTSYAKVNELELAKSSEQGFSYEVGDYYIIQVPRSRSVHQSYFTSIFTTLFSIIYSIPFVLCRRPDLILCNGPGTCIPICGLAFLLKVAFIKDIRIVFVESFCRTKTFSLSGKILMYIADNFIVQWPRLKTKCKRAEYIGQLM